MINQQCGGAVIAPWEIEQLELDDDEWIDVFIGLSKLPKMRESYRAFDNLLAEIRSKHPTYRKYM